MPVSAVDAINPAFQHTKQQLLQPFRFGQWTRLAFVGLLAGEMGSAGGCNFNFSLPAPHHPKGTEQFLGASWPAGLAQHPVLFAGLIIFLVLAGLVLFVLMIYVSSVMRFILFDSIISRVCHIRKGWTRHQRHGFQLCVWQIVLTLLFSAAIAVPIAVAVASIWGLGWLDRPSEHLLPLILSGFAAFLFLMIAILAFAVVHVMTKDFVVPQMALEDISPLEGWRRLWLALAAEKGSYTGYIGMKFVLAIAAGIAFGIVTLIAILVLLIPIGGVGAIAVFGGMAAGWTWNFYTIALAVVAGCIALLIFLFAASFISVPAIVFFPAYSIYFFAPRYPILAAILWPQPPAMPADASPLSQPPTLPPTPQPFG